MKRSFYALLAMMLVMISTCACAADDSGDSVPRYDHPETGNMALIWDDADLLTDDEEARLLEIMQPITAYGHVIFSTDTNRAGKRTSDLAMYNLRKVCRPRKSGAIYDVVTTSNADAKDGGIA